MKVKIQQVLPRGFYKVEPHSWECELYKEDENGQILVAVDYYCREKDIKDAKIGDFVAVRLDEKSGKTGTVAGQIVEIHINTVCVYMNTIIASACNAVFLMRKGRMERIRKNSKRIGAVALSSFAH